VGRANIIILGVREGAGFDETFLKFGVRDGSAKVRCVLGIWHIFICTRRCNLMLLLGGSLAGVSTV